MRPPLALLSAVFLASGARAQVVRGPYVADASTGALTVCWQAAGEGFSCLSRSGLPGTSVEYAVPGSTEARRARLLPGRGSPVSFAAFGDCGTGKAAQAEVAALLERLSPDMVLLLGDLVYPDGALGDYDAKYFRPYAASLARVPFFPALGNHDYGNSTSTEAAQSAYLRGYRTVHRRPKYYSFDAGDVHFVSIDDNEAFGIPAAEPLGPGSSQAAWLAEDLARSSAAWKVAFLHVPLRSSGYYGDDAMLLSVLTPVLERGGVDLVLQGHDHLYERIGPVGGIVYATVGTGGKSLYGKKLLNPSSRKVFLGHGLLLGRALGGRLSLSMIAADGTTVDSWTLSK